MKPKQALLMVFTIVLLGEAVAELLATHREILTAGLCLAIFLCVVYVVKRQQTR